MTWIPWALFLGALCGWMWHWLELRDERSWVMLYKAREDYMRREMKKRATRPSYPATHPSQWRVASAVLDDGEAEAVTMVAGDLVQLDPETLFGGKGNA